MPKQNRKPGIHLHKTKNLDVIESKGTGLESKYLYRYEYFWILIAKNGKTIAKSSETYKRKRNAVRSIEIAESLFLGHAEYYDHTKKEVG